MGFVRKRLWRVALPPLAAAFIGAFASVVACSDDGDLEVGVAADDADDVLPPLHPREADPLGELPRGSTQLARLCARDGDDMVRDFFCADEAPVVKDLVTLQRALVLDDVHLVGSSGLSIAGHSTSLSAHTISTINPRVIGARIEHPELDADGKPAGPTHQFGVVPKEYELAGLAFSRGDQFVELMVRDRVDHELRFYLVTFRQACNDSDEGCSPGDLLTEAIESDWRDTTVYDEGDLANTVLDCATCHQSDGPGTAKYVRMQELQTPWTHWFGLTEGGRSLMDDYLAAKGDETLAGLSSTRVSRANPVSLNLQVVYGGPNVQPNVFDSKTIEAEVQQSAAAQGGEQPHDNRVPGESATWRVGYERARRGEAITFPYHDVKVTDASKLARMSEAYRAYRDGELARAALPDISDVFPDNPRQLAEMGFITEPGLSGEDVLLQACASCHNARLDQTLTRARFRADLEGMSRDEKDRAIERLRLPVEDPQAMPPPRARLLTSEARRRAIAALRR
ncbi:MAG: hypothetical protein ABW321_31255 [Polyangiales bacterium]